MGLVLVQTTDNAPSAMVMDISNADAVITMVGLSAGHAEVKVL